MATEGDVRRIALALREVTEIAGPVVAAMSAVRSTVPCPASVSGRLAPVPVSVSAALSNSS